MGMGKEVLTLDEVQDAIVSFDGSVDVAEVTQETVDEMNGLIENENFEKVDAVIEVLEEEDILDPAFHEEFLDFWNGINVL